MEANNNSKTREVLNRVHEFLSNLCRDARCDDHCSECLGASDLADDVYDLLHTPSRNCDVGTPEEQVQRFMAVCESIKPAEPHYSETGEVLCPSIGSGQECKLGICNFGQCALKWAQTPYEAKEGGAK